MWGLEEQPAGSNFQVCCIRNASNFQPTEPAANPNLNPVMNQSDVIEFRHIRNVPEVINVTFDFFRQNFRSLAKALFLFAFPPLAVAYVLFSYFFWGFIDSLARNVSDIEAVFLPMFLAFMCAGLLVAVGATILIIVVHDFVRLYREKDGMETIGLSEIGQGIKANFWMLFGTLLGLGFAGSIISALMSLVPFGGLGMYAIVVFGAFYLPLRIYDRRGVLQSFVVSADLVKGSWWRTFGLLILFSLLNLVLVGVLALPVMVGAVVSSYVGVDLEMLKDASWLRIAGTILVSAYYTGLSLLYAIPLLSLIFHYFSQKERRGSPALLAEIEMIGSEESV